MGNFISKCIVSINVLSICIHICNSTNSFKQARKLLNTYPIITETPRNYFKDWNKHSWLNQIYQIEKYDNNQYKLKELIASSYYGTVLLVEKLPSTSASSKQFAMKIQDVTAQKEYETSNNERKILTKLIDYKQQTSSKMSICIPIQISKLYDTYETTKINNIKSFVMVSPCIIDGDLEKFMNWPKLKQHKNYQNERNALQQVSLLFEDIGIKGLKILHNKLDKPYYFFDMKPGNILIIKKEDTKNYIQKFLLTDFGSANPSHIANKGTPAYSSDIVNQMKIANGFQLEELRKVAASNPGGVVDIYGLAAVAFEFYYFIGCDFDNVITVKGEQLKNDNGLCRAAAKYSEYLQFNSNLGNTKCQEKRREIITQAYHACHGKYSNVECELTKFFYTAFNSNEISKLDWEYVKKIVNMLNTINKHSTGKSAAQPPPQSQISSQSVGYKSNTGNAIKDAKHKPTAEDLLNAITKHYGKSAAQPPPQSQISQSNTGNAVSDSLNFEKNVKDEIQKISQILNKLSIDTRHKPNTVKDLINFKSNAKYQIKKISEILNKLYSNIEHVKI